MTEYVYTKNDGEVSERVLHAVTKPNFNVRALDLSALSPGDQVKAARLYDEWVETHFKPFGAKAKEFEKANLKSLDEFFKEGGLETLPLVKSFNSAGLVKKA